MSEYKVYLDKTEGGYSVRTKLMNSGAKSINKKFSQDDLINGNDITKNNLKWAMVDKFAPLLRNEEAFIINTDLSSGNGIHWVVLYPRGNICYIIDSLGQDNDRPNDDILYETIEDAGLKAKFYPHSFQFLDNSMCGFFAMYVCKLINKNKNADVFKMVTDVFGTDADDGDIQKLIDGFGMNGKQLDKIYDMDVNGEGILDHLKGIYHAIRGTRDNYPPSMRKILKTVGDFSIKRLEVGRIPINSIIQKVIDGISRENKYDKLFHLFLVLHLNNGSVYRLEKNQSLNLIPWSAKKTKDEKRIGLGFRGQHTLNTLLNNAIKKVGKERIFHYKSTSNNCQRFVLDVLDSSNIEMSDSYRKWILQDVKNLLPGYAEKIANFGTDLKNKIDLVVDGHGKCK
jgi:hypothetical protein